MYSIGDYFDYEVEGEEIEFEVLATLTYDSDDYVITDNGEGTFHVFLDNDDDDLSLVEDDDIVSDVLEYWKESLKEDSNIGDWEDDEYYEREDKLGERESFDNEDYRDEDY